ncbi:MAG: hypothetical protein QGI05_01915 [Candidatus Omnitrophota bacterium]|jgi:hypothetical protein|nr:hypothetical protein [Candidatus Omnitrophota bacterium]
MKKLMSLLLLIAFVGGVVLITSEPAFARRKKKDKKKSEEKADAGKVLHKFDSSDEMAEFEQLYVAKQATFGRMGVLQAYFAMEQNNLVEIDRQLQEKFGFKMELDKMYDLNRDDREIREVGPIPAPAQ